jgi:hypothetical protein
MPPEFPSFAADAEFVSKNWIILSILIHNVT